MPDILTLKQLCDRYSINRHTYYNLSRKGKMPPAFNIGRQVRFKLSDVLDWEAEQGAADQAVPGSGA